MGQLHALDLYLFFAYMLILLGIGFWAGRKKKGNASDYFLSHNSLPWYVIGFSFVAATVSSQQLIGSVGFAYKFGLAVANFEWMNWFAILLLVFIFIPFYIRKKVVTMPQYLELRYNGKVRTLFALITLLTYIFINLAGVVFAGAFALHKIFDVEIIFCIVTLCLVAGSFSIYGGMESIAWTNVFQSILLLLSGLIVCLIGWQELPGGISDIIGHGDRAHLILPAAHPELPGTGLIVLLTSTNIWFYCSNQSINQSSLGAKNEWHAKMGVIMVGFLSVFVAFADVIPGLIAYALNPNLEVADEAYLYIIKTIIPVGLKGVMLAVLCGGTITAIEALVNASSSIFTMDIYQRMKGGEISSGKLLKVARLASLGVLMIGALWAPVVQQFDQIFSYFQECWAFIAIPVSVIFVMGVLWKGVTSKAALLTLSLSFPMLLFPYLLRILKISVNVFNVAAFVLIFTILFCWTVSLLTRSNQEESSEFIWNSSMAKETNDDNFVWYRSIVFWSALMVIVYLILYLLLW